MDISYALQHYLFLMSLLAGVVCGAVYDIFRILRAFAFKNRVIVFVEDVLFCLFVTACFLVLFYNYSEGRLRFYAFTGVILGFSAYYFTVGAITRRIVEAIRRLLLKIYRKSRRALSLFIHSIYGRLYSYRRIRAAARKAKGGFV